ncbi:MAG TPA: DUF5343 domain-containing protein [Allosphingosinicella sp.]|nr:DUF5343 domain-containing protein [Allosphingosinicella sp.]
MYPSTQNTGTLTNVISAIGKHGFPAKFTTKDLPVWGYKSSHDRSVVGVLRFIGFLDSSGVPTDLWREARTDPALAVAKGTREAYSELFQTFPDAHRKDTESLTNFFKAKTTASEPNVKKMVGTFKALAQYGNFDGIETASPEGNTSAKVPRPETPIHNSQTKVPTDDGLAVVMNIQLSLPGDASGEVYDKFFAAMRKHLFDAKSK